MVNQGMREIITGTTRVAETQISTHDAPCTPHEPRSRLFSLPFFGSIQQFSAVLR